MQSGSIPPETKISTFERNSDGLVKGVTYSYTPLGKIDWKAMLRREDLYIMEKYRADASKLFEGLSYDKIDPKTLPDKWVCANLAGMVRLLHLRGYHSITYPQIIIHPDRAVASCQIEFIGNFETGGKSRITSSVASASPASVDKFYRPYIETLAENRALVRAIKRELEITIVNIEEIDKNADLPQSDTTASVNSQYGFKPNDLLKKKCKEFPAGPISFASVKKASIDHNAKQAADSKDRLVSGPETWESFDSISEIDCWMLMGILAKKEAELPKKK